MPRVLAVLVALGALSVVAACAAPSALTAASSTPADGPPPIRHLVEVDDVFAVPASRFVIVLRTVETPARYVPIWVGEREALAIQMRLERYSPPRPLTLNLLESVLQSGRIELREVTIDDVRDGVFLGSLHLAQGSRFWHVDARPSDAISLALTSGKPIWVLQRVLDGASFELEGLAGQQATPAPSPGNGDPGTERGLQEAGPGSRVDPDFDL